MAERSLAVMHPPEVDIFDDRRLRMVREMFANGAPEEDFALFIEFCRSRNLDPLQRQVYLIPRSDKASGGKKWSIQTSIDGYRAIADRTGAYAGSDDPVFVEKAGALFTATVTVWRFVQSQRCPFTATARWDEYTQEKSPLWVRMPHQMLSKCAESLALRKAFPVQLGGLYTTEEMMQAGPVPTAGVRVTETVDEDTGEIIEVAPQACPDRSGGDDRTNQNARFFAIGASHGWSDAALKLFALSQYPWHDRVRTISRKQLTTDELRTLGTMMEDEIGRQVHATTGVIIPTPEVEFANAIAVAADQKTLAEIGAQLKSGGIAAPWIRKMWAYRNREVPAVSATLIDADEGPEGEPGSDRFTA